MRNLKLKKIQGGLNMKTHVYLFIFFLFLPTIWLQGKMIDDGTIIDTETAIQAASDYLPQFYTGEWEYYTHFTYYDLDNKPAAYDIVFRKKDSKVENIEELRKMMEKKYREMENTLSRIQTIRDDPTLSGKEKNVSITTHSAKISNLKNSIQGIGNFTSILTGAVDTSSVILKCRKGLPETFFREIEVEKEIEKNFPSVQARIEKVVYLGLFDIFYKIGALGDFSNVASNTSVNGGQQLFHLRTGQLFSLAELEKKVVEKKLSLLQAQNQDRISAINKNKAKWAYYRNLEKLSKKQPGIQKETGVNKKIVPRKSEVKRMSNEAKEIETAQKLTPQQQDALTRQPGKENTMKPGKLKEAVEEKK